MFDLGTLIEAFVAALIVGPIVLLIAMFVGLSWGLGFGARRFLSGATARDLPPGTPVQIALRAESASSHALWLDLEFEGAAPAYEVEARLTADGGLLSQVAHRVERSASGWVGLGPGSELALGDVRRGSRTKVVQRILLFVPPKGSAIEAVVKLTPAAGASCLRSRALVTTSSEP